MTGRAFPSWSLPSMLRPGFVLGLVLMPAGLVAQPPPPPPPVDMPPPRVLAPAGWEAVDERDGTTTRLGGAARLALPLAPTLLRDPGWQVAPDERAAVSATFASGPVSRYGLVLGLGVDTGGGVACVVSGTGHVWLGARTADVASRPWVPLAPRVARRVAAGEPHVLTLALDATAVTCGVDGEVVARLPREGGAGVGGVGVWTAGTGAVRVAGVRLEVGR